jgi:hypothetical protein
MSCSSMMVMNVPLYFLTSFSAVVTMAWRAADAASKCSWEMSCHWNDGVPART